MLIDINQVKLEIEEQIDRFSAEIKKLRTGKATMELFDNIKVEAYGAMNKLTAVGNVIIEDAMNVKISIWDKTVMPNVEKSLRESNIGATILREADHIRVKFSPLTEEDRKARVKDLKLMLEDTKVSVRQVRQKFMKKLVDMEGVSEDEQKRDENEVQKRVDEGTGKLDELATKKESEIMQIS